MTDQEKQQLAKGLSNDNLAVRYQQFINYIIDGSKTGLVDRMEYRVFVEQTLKRDLQALAVAYLNMALSFEEYFQKIEMIVGWNLMILGIIEGNIKGRGDGGEK